MSVIPGLAGANELNTQTRRNCVQSVLMPSLRDWSAYQSPGKKDRGCADTEIRGNGENHDDDGDEGGDARACSAIESRNCAFP